MDPALVPAVPHLRDIFVDLLMQANMYRFSFKRTASVNILQAIVARDPWAAIPVLNSLASTFCMASAAERGVISQLQGIRYTPRGDAARCCDLEKANDFREHGLLGRISPNGHLQ